MTNIIKLSIFAGVLAIVFGVFAFIPTVSNTVKDTVLTPVAALAFGESGDGGCCGGGGGGGGYSQGRYYSQGGYYSQGYYQTTYLKDASCDFLNGSPTTLPYGGGQVTLEWGTTDATSVSINNGIGNVSADGSKTVNVTQTTTFVLTAEGTGNDDDCQVTITVEDQEEFASCDSFTASPNSFNNGVGGQVTLTWNTTNANSVSINNGVGSVSADGSTSVNVTGNTTFILTAVGTDGNDTCEAPVVVNQVNEELRCDFLTASPSSIRSSQNITLEWGTTGATSANLSGVGSVAVDGSTTVFVDNDRTFVLTINKGNDTKSCQVSVDLESGGGGGGGSSSPRCELEISDKKVKVGEKVTLTWDTSRATKVEIEDDKGKEIFSTDDYDSDDKSDYYDGEIDVIINRDTEFTLNASKGSKDRTCKVEVEVEDDPIKVYEKRDQPLVISLREVPYTGFEAGPMLTALFYALLAIWALFVAYIVVFKKNPLLGFKLKTNAEVAEADAALEYKKKVQTLAAMHSHQPWK